MVATARLSLALNIVVVAVLTSAVQVPFTSSDSLSSSYSTDDASSSGNRAGRFLHITDIHPDQYYTAGAKVNDACHEVAAEKTASKKKRKKAKRAGYWGAPVSVCDSPKHLVTATFDWLARSWNEEQGDERGTKAFDFIIWTGDTARHDIDFTHPRKAEEIFDYNRWALKLLEERFPGTPIVPNVGNNDIIPHNIMFPGPNSMTRAYHDIWRDYIAPEQHEAFLDGGYFSAEVLPDDLAVLSLNTLYWYDNNAATRGCKKASSPGSIQLDWLTDQLFDLRNRSMQAHLVGHVPPTAGNYFADCYDQYTDIVLRFQDTIVGQHFGHMNIDAMFLQEDLTIVSDLQTADEENRTIGIRSLTSDLRKDYDLVPTSQKADLDAYMPFFAGPSIVPTYLPTVRIWTYNNSRPADRLAGPSRSSHDVRLRSWRTEDDVDPYASLLVDNGSFTYDVAAAQHAALDLFSRSHRRPRHHKGHKNHRKIPRHASAHSPSRRNQYLTMLGYSQWVLDLQGHNKRHQRDAKKAEEQGLAYHLEYTTYDEQTLWSDYFHGDEQDKSAAHVHRPVPKALLDREIERRKAKAPASVSSLHPLLRYFTTTKRKPTLSKRLRHLTDYRLPSMTIEHVLELARELAGNDKLWSRHERRIYTESGFEA